MFRRYAIYFTPPSGPLSDFGAAWLGWDMTTGAAAANPPITGLPLPLSEITQTPRKYGLHATLKPPFALAAGTDTDQLAHRLETFCASRAPVTIPMLDLAQLGRFLALVPAEPCPPLADLAAGAVRDFDGFRAPLSAAEMDRRRAGGLTEAQEANLLAWGYPHVMDAFRFHITLSGKLPKNVTAQVRNALAPHLAPLLPAPFVIDALSLAGEAEDGMFHLIHRTALCG